MMLPSAEFPTIACEVGWSETHSELMDDVRLWLLYTMGQTRLVVVVKFTESRKGSSPGMGNNRPGVEDSEYEVENNESGVESEGPVVRRDTPEEGNREPVVEDTLLEVNGGPEVGNDESGDSAKEDNDESGDSAEEDNDKSGDSAEEDCDESGDSAEEDTNTSEEQIIINSIDGSTGYHDLAARLLDLNRRGGLREPLVGDLGATIHIYKATDDGKDIEEKFTCTLLPPPDIDQEGPKGFGITLDDLFGGSVPPNLDREEVLWFSLERLVRFVTSSLPETERSRANARAVKLLQEAGEWEERETYSQRKRRRLNTGQV